MILKYMKNLLQKRVYLWLKKNFIYHRILLKKRVMDIPVYGEIMMVCEKLSDGFTRHDFQNQLIKNKLYY